MNIKKKNKILSLLQQPIDRLIATNHGFIFIDCGAIINQSFFLFFLFLIND
jgi:hypothetical protein